MTRVDPAGANAPEEDTARREMTRDDARDADAESRRATDATTTRVVRVVSDSDDESVKEDIAEDDIAEDDIAEEDIAEEDIADASFSYADASFASDAPEEPRSVDAAPVPSPGPSSPDADDDDAHHHHHHHHHHRARPPRRSLGERSDVSISVSVSTSASSPRASATLVASPSSRVFLPPVSPPRAPRRPDSPAFDRGVPPLPPTPTARAPAAARRGGATSPKARSPPAKRSTTTTTRMNPVLARTAELARRRRDAARHPEKRTTTRSMAMERSSTEPSRTVPSPTRDYLRRAESHAAPTRRPRRATEAAAAADTSSSPPRRCVRVDLVSALPEFSAAVAAALAASGAKGYLVASDEAAEEADAANAPPKARVAVVADAPAVRAAAKPDSAYRPVPAHRTYAWYKHYGFAGKGAKTSWGYNPKREDIKARYDDVKGRGE